MLKTVKQLHYNYNVIVLSGTLHCYHLAKQKGGQWPPFAASVPALLLIALAFTVALAFAGAFVLAATRLAVQPEVTPLQGVKFL